MPRRANSVFRAIADPTRRELFHVLVVAGVAMTINQISAKFDISRQGVTKHLKILEEAELVTINAQGRQRYCQANPYPLKEVNEWVSTYEQFWDSALGNLAAYLDKPKD